MQLLLPDHAGPAEWGVGSLKGRQQFREEFAELKAQPIWSFLVPGRLLPWKKVLTMTLLKTASYAIARRTKMTALAGFYKY